MTGQGRARRLGVSGILISEWSWCVCVRGFQSGKGMGVYIGLRYILNVFISFTMHGFAVNLLQV